ncbi:type II and III secretion system protein family protein [Caulobacter sp. KR2-114]|uniref:type II and III secretion system protein family protein n=1 Tax=Caulobacter sp. KR2-114 TaxID=3400912 RepID=UPI003BFB9C18
MKVSLMTLMSGLAKAALPLALLAAAPAVAGQAETATAAGPGAAYAPASVRVDLSAGATSQSLALPAGKSALIDLPVDARDVLVTRPGVADVLLRSPRRISVLGVKEGTTDAIFFDGAGRRILSLDIRVDIDGSAVAAMINKVIPGSHVHVDGMNGSLVLSGEVASTGDADKAVQLARAAVDKPEKVISMINIAGKDQVMLKVRIVEMQRNVIKQLGFNLSALYGQTGLAQYVFSHAPTYGVNGSLLGGATGGYQLDTTKQPELQVPCMVGLTGTCMQVVHGPGSGIANWDTATTQTTSGSPGLNQANAMVQAFERVGLVRTLAEPNLTAVSGESAKFLAGGEFPVPTGQDNTGKVTIDFKPFGVGLGFTPVVLSAGRISLKISTEVSELSNEGSFSLGAGSSTSGGTTTQNVVVVPSLTVRRAETVVELPSGGSMMIAGLLQDKTKQDLDSEPGLMNLPVLGALFRSRDYQAGQTELVVIVTPYLVNPASPADLATPADGLQIANDIDTVLLGRINKASKRSPDATAGHSYQGPYGYVVE